MSIRALSLLLLLAVAATPVAAEETPEAREIIARAIAAAGGEAFAALGILELDVTAEEIRADGSQNRRAYTLYVDTANLNNMRMELPGDVVIGSNKAGGWSSNAGIPDDRPQIPAMARKTLQQTAFPLLLPYSLQMDGVRPTEVGEREVDGREAWVIAIPFVKGFFTNPVMTTTWVLLVAKDDYSIISIEFAPAPGYRDVSPVGIRYTILKRRQLEGATVAEQVLSTGINPMYQESGSNRVTKVDASVVPWDLGLFLSPAQLEAIEEN